MRTENSVEISPNGSTRDGISTDSIAASSDVGEIPKSCWFVTKKANANIPKLKKNKYCAICVFRLTNFLLVSIRMDDKVPFIYRGDPLDRPYEKQQ